MLSRTAKLTLAAHGTFFFEISLHVIAYFTCKNTIKESREVTLEFFSVEIIETIVQKGILKTLKDLKKACISKYVFSQ